MKAFASRTPGCCRVQSVLVLDVQPVTFYLVRAASQQQQQQQQQQAEEDASAAGAAAAATLSGTAVQLSAGDPFLLAVEAEGGPIAAYKEGRLRGLFRKVGAGCRARPSSPLAVCCAVGAPAQGVCDAPGSRLLPGSCNPALVNPVKEESVSRLAI